MYDLLLPTTDEKIINKFYRICKFYSIHYKIKFLGSIHDSTLISVDESLKPYTIKSMWCHTLGVSNNILLKPTEGVENTSNDLKLTEEVMKALYNEATPSEEGKPMMHCDMGGLHSKLLCKDMGNSNMKKFVCIARCPELDCENAVHCTATEEETYCDYCPCGNDPIWKKL